MHQLVDGLFPSTPMTCRVSHRTSPNWFRLSQSSTVVILEVCVNKNQRQSIALNIFAELDQMENSQILFFRWSKHHAFLVDLPMDDGTLTVVAMASSYSRLFQWDFTFYIIL